MELEIKKMRITPELADEWLDKNTDNYRKARRDKVRDLVNAIEQGLWKLTHQGIAFDEDGTLIDGQHRLMAIAESGITVEMFVAFGVAKDGIDYMDIGAKRQFSDVLTRRGEKNAALMASTILRLWYWFNSEDRIRDRNYVPTFEERLQFLREHPDLRDSIIMSGNVKATNTNLSLTHYVFGRISVDERDYFFEHLLAAEQLLDTSHPIMLLRRTLSQEYEAQKLGSRPSELRQLAMIIKTWNAFRSRQTIKHLRYAAHEKFPMPI